MILGGAGCFGGLIDVLRRATGVPGHPNGPTTRVGARPKCVIIVVGA